MCGAEITYSCCKSTFWLLCEAGHHTPPCSLWAKLVTCGQVRGATAHFDAVVGAATSGVLGAAADSGVPVVFCVMTTDTMEQARIPNVLHSILDPCLVFVVHCGGLAVSENAH